MAGKIYISEYADLPVISVGQVLPVGREPALAEQLVNTSATSAQSAAFNAKTKFVRVHAATIVSIKFGANPTAVVGEKRMAAGATEFFGVNTGDKLAGIDNT